MSEATQKVVGLRGERINYETGSDQSVVDLLRETLEKAERGEIIAVGLTTVSPTEFIRSEAAGGQRHNLLAGTVYLQHWLAK